MDEQSPARMALAVLSPAAYVLDERWSSAQERNISTAYPFEPHAEGPEDYVVRTYLQFLWLPQSIMSLNYLIPSLQRVNAPSGSSPTIPHPMHVILEPLLLTTSALNKKYRSELAHILSNNGGAGGMEEAMMWYAVEHDKPLDDDGHLSGKSPQKHGKDGEEGPWTIEKWRESYLERMERREVQIQILLYLFKLSLPGPQPAPTAESNNTMSKKRKRPAIYDPPEPILTADDHLETFMDKLAIWQLVERVDGALNKTNTGLDKKRKNLDDRHWTQIFAEDIVEPQFKYKLPEACKLLRSKVFPTSPFSDAESDTSTTRKIVSPEPITPRYPTSYVPTEVPLKKPLSRVPSTSISLAPSASSHAHPLSRHLLSKTHPKSSDCSRKLVRSRSRSLSLSLAQEQEEREAAAVAAAEQHSKKRLNREVSMSRVCKSKAKGKIKGISRIGEGKKEDLTFKISAPKVEKRHKEDKGVTLVEETPVKTRVSSTLNVQQQPVPIMPLIFGTTSGVQKNGAKLIFGEIGEEEEEWMMDSSPAVVVFDPLLEKTKRRTMSSGDASSMTVREEASDGSIGLVKGIQVPTKLAPTKRTRKRAKNH